MNICYNFKDFNIVFLKQCSIEIKPVNYKIITIFFLIDVLLFGVKNCNQNKIIKELKLYHF